MIRYRGKEEAGRGTYWNLKNGERVEMSAAGRLPGSGGEVYYRMPAAAILLLGPVAGLVFAAFLPFIGIAMAVRLAAEKVAGTVMVPAMSTATFGWRPSESYLAGRKRKEEKREDAGEESNEPNE